MSTNEKKLKTASVLAFERKLDPSDARFSAGQWSERATYSKWPAIVVHEKSVRGTISNRLKAKDQDPAKLDAEVEKPNLQTVDVATLPHDADTLAVHFTLRVLPGVGHPSACNDTDYQNKLKQTVNGYISNTGLGELARRYAYNLANGRFLWRNRIGAESIEVVVSQLTEGKAQQQWRFDALDFPLRVFDENADTQALGDLVEEALTGQTYLLLDVVAFVRMGEGQEVFPSQELILDRSRGDKSKTLYRIGEENAAAIHSQKIGNALRTIDTWYPETEGNEGLGPIAVEPYGSVTTLGTAFRQPREKVDFYNLLDNWLLKDKVPAVEQQHFVMAVLIRGGVFGEAG